MKIINAKDLRNWSRFFYEMQRLKKIFPEYAGFLKSCVLQVAEKIRPSVEHESEETIEEIQRQAEGLRLCYLCGFPLDKQQEKFCSKICRSIADRKRYLKGKYPCLRVDGQRVYLHRLIWEKNNRKLRKGEVVHHINEDPRDNRPENLQAMTNSAHTALHFSLRRKQRRDLNRNLFELED